MKEMSLKTPSSVYVRLTEFILTVVTVIHDQVLDVRKAAADALTVCLNKLVRRSKRHTLDW